MAIKKKWVAGMMALGMSMGVWTSAATAEAGQSELAQVRQATAQYHQVSKAKDAGYEPVGPAFELDGYGTMGVHYINFSYLFDNEINPAKPEVLLYTWTKDQKDGERLIGVEYVVAADAWQGDGPPTLFGQPFEGVMDGHGPGEPPHYDKHVWLWQANPKGTSEPQWKSAPGMFSQLNPNVQCENCVQLPQATHESHE